jgi:hypothetical protein
VSGQELFAYHYHQIPGLTVLQGLAVKLLGLALVLWLLIELYRFITRGSADFVTPVVRVGLALLVVQSIGLVGDFFGGLAETASAQLFEQNDKRLLLIAYEHIVEKTEVSFSPLLPGLSLRLLIGIGSMLLYIGMLVVKFMVIDVLFPLTFGLVLMLGVVAVPLSMFPGVSSISGWFKNLIEVALWPVIFQVLLALLVASFQGLLQRTASLDLGSALGDAAGRVSSDRSLAGLSQTEFGVLLQFWGLCLGYMVMCLMTPIVAAMVIRSTPVGIVGGVAAAKSIDLMKAAIAGGVALIGGAAGAPAVAAAGASEAGPALTAAVKPTTRIEEADTKKIDRRAYDAPEE